MPERKIKHRVFAYFEDTEDPATGRDVRVERFARRGETVDLPKADAARGDRLGSFYSSDETVERDGEEFSPSEATLDELVSWIEEDKPNVQEVVNAAGQDPAVAKRLLDAENAVTGNDPRNGVLEGLTAVVERGGE